MPERPLNERMYRLVLLSVLALAIFELPPIGWQLFILGSSQGDSTAFPAFLGTYATRLLAEPLRRSNGSGSPPNPKVDV